MENLSIQDLPAGGGTLGPNHASLPPPGGPPQLPPQMFTTAAQLLDLTDKKLVVVLRDGRKFAGILRSWDQFANLVLQDTTERVFAKDLYADVSKGTFLVRGENVLLLGEVDLDKDEYVPEPFRKVNIEELEGILDQQKKDTKESEKRRAKRLGEMGFEMEHSGEVLF